MGRNIEYLGFWKEDKISGEGTLKRHSMMILEGRFDRGELREGWILLELEDDDGMKK